jgi:serine/threonine-protein kinase
MPIAPLLATGTELQAGVVPHALRFILPNANIQSGIYLHPGTHLGGPSGGTTMPPYTARFRLKSSFNVASLPSAGARAVAVAMQTYGMFLDDGGNIPLTLDASAAAYIGSHDLSALQVTDFDMVASPDPAVTFNGNCTRTQLTN